MSPQRRRGPYRRPAPDAARRAAFQVLRAVDEDDAYANLALPAELARGRLDTRDAAFATELTYGTLRRRGTWDAVISRCVDRPLADVDAPVLDVLRLGAHQLLGMRVPGHAAVSATVELARAVLGEGRASFVNAVLRKVSRTDLDGWLALLAGQAADETQRLSVAYSHPAWVVSALRDALSAHGLGGELEALLEADNVPPLVTLAARPGRCSVDQLVAEGARPGRWSPVAAVLGAGGDPGSLPEVRDGRAGVQDEGSQLVALALAEAPLGAGPDARWLDLCAGPGGKAALLAAVATGRAARLTAVEPAPHRARLVEAALRGDTGGHTVVVADGTDESWAGQDFDRVLVDVPCTGLGALRRRPEARWRRRPEDLPRLAPLQRALLARALDAVRPGGVVGYVTCSPHLAETTSVVADVLRRRPPGEVETLDARSLLPAGMTDLGDGPAVQLWPHRHGTDAMFLCLLRRSGTPVARP